LPSVIGDSTLLTQLVQNLIANALKFCEAHPNISIDFEETPKDWIFSVKDNGIGFDPTQKEEIFSLYKKLNSPAAFQGSGIGLATCKKVIEIHGGQIWAVSEPKVGSTFYFSLRKR
jgi:signal transduction histidine kinase